MGSFVGSGHVDREINSPCPLLKMLTSKESLAGIELSVCTPQLEEVAECTLPYSSSNLLNKY